MSVSKPLLASLLLIATVAVSGARADDQAPDDVAAKARPHHIYLVGQLRLLQPWIDADTDSKDHADGFVVIENRGDAPDRLVGARVDVADTVSLSPSASETDTTASLPIPPTSVVGLKQGDAHLVLHGVHRDIARGDRIKGVITFERAGPVDVEFTTNRTDAINDDQTDLSTESGAKLAK